MIYHSKILEKLEERHNQTGGHCGLYLKDFEGDIQELKQAMNELYIQNKITTHDGIHGLIIKINKNGKI